VGLVEFSLPMDAPLTLNPHVSSCSTAARRGKVATPPSAAGAWASNAVLTSKAGLYFISGAVGDHVGKDAGVKAHTAAALEEIKKRLEAVGLGLNDIVSSSQSPTIPIFETTRVKQF
jgi:enamine deaminase RidA (YjgF/YER057c/UK114 family)